MLESENGRAETLAHLEAMALEVRIPCECIVVVGDQFASILQRESGHSSLVFLGMADPREQAQGFVDYLDDIAGEVPRVLFVYSAGDMSLHA